MNDKCEIKRCRQESSVEYYGHAICEKHYNEDCNNAYLKKLFAVEE